MSTAKSKCNQCQHRGFRHSSKCVYVTGKPDIDYVVCNICGIKALNLTFHLKKDHSLTKENYDGNFCSKKSFEQRSKAHKGKENWVSRYRKTNPDLLKQMIVQMGSKVSDTILANNEERKRRSETLKLLWKNDFFRIKAVANCSKTAIKTSSRKDILFKRGEKLAHWRKEEPDKFYEKCTSKLVSAWKSKGEKDLFLHVKTNFSDFNFVNGSSISSPKFTNKSKKHQVDILERNKKIILEFDGLLHFKNIPKWNQLEEVQNRDLEFNKILSEEYLVIRVSSDQWSAKKGFTEDSKLKILSLINDYLNNSKPELHLIGNLYVENKIS